MSTENWNTGFGSIISRDTEHDSATQRMGGLKFPDVEDVTSAVNPNIDSQWMGGPIPGHSQHWADYFGGDFMAPPMGDKPVLAATPDAQHVLTAVADPQQVVTAGGSDFWRTFQNIVWGPMRNAHKSY